MAENGAENMPVLRVRQFLLRFNTYTTEIGVFLFCKQKMADRKKESMYET